MGGRVTYFDLEVNRGMRLCPSWMAVAMAEYGTKEVGGLGHNERILEYLRSCDPMADADEIAWCSAFVNWCFKQVGIQGTQRLLAKSYLHWGLKLERPHLGCLVISERGNEAWMGHINFFVSQANGFVYGLGGNQSNEVNIMKIPEHKVLCYRTPKFEKVAG